MSDGSILAPDSWLLTSFDLFGRLVPHRDRLVKIGIIGHVAGDGGVVAEDGVLDGGAARSDRLEKIVHVVDLVLVAGRRLERLRLFDHGIVARGRVRMLGAPLLQIFAAQLFGPAEDRVALWL